MTAYDKSLRLAPSGEPKISIGTPCEDVAVSTEGWRPLLPDPSMGTRGCARRRKLTAQHCSCPAQVPF
jgi:hypothetical protein